MNRSTKHPRSAWQVTASFAVCLGGLGFTPVAAAGQADPAGAAHHRNECRKARQILVHGQPANKVAWAQQIIPTCDDVQGTIVEGFEAHRSDDVESEELERLVLLTNEVVDAGILAKAMDIATDPAAGRIARLQALRVVFNQRRPMTYVTLDRLVEGAGFLESRSFIFGRDPLVTNPLPPNSDEQVASAMDTIIGEPGVDADLLKTARRLRALATRPPGALPP